MGNSDTHMVRDSPTRASSHRPPCRPASVASHTGLHTHCTCSGFPYRGGCLELPLPSWLHSSSGAAGNLLSLPTGGQAALPVCLDQRPQDVSQVLSGGPTARAF